jgi:mRNA interferase MazF
MPPASGTGEAGEIWTVGAGSGQASRDRRSSSRTIGSTRPTSVTICAFTIDPTEAPLIRLLVEPDAVNGLRERSSLMVDKVATVPRSRLRERIA